jgi:hypothetical protein
LSAAVALLLLFLSQSFLKIELIIEKTYKFMIFL